MISQKYLEKKIGPHACLRVITILFSGELNIIGNLLLPRHARAVSAR